jgi:cation-transporting ATPase F
MGRIAGLIGGAEELRTPLTRKIAHFSRLLLYAIAALAVLVICSDKTWHEMFMAAIALAVGAIPEC